MIGDALVFDGVAHPFNFEADNARGPAGTMFSNHLYAFHTVLTPEGLPLMSAEEFLHKWSVEEIHEMVYANSDTDMLVAMPLPLTDLYHDGLSPWTECAKLAQLDPDRTVMWGTVNPLEGKKALDDVTRQVEEYGATAFKFYNVRYEDGGQVPWRMDDPKVAFPVFERIQELGVNLIGVHKGVPLGPQMIEHTQTWDMDGAAGAFPDINFVIYHVGLPFIDETCWQLIRYPNLHASLAASINFVVRAPAAVRRAARQAAVLVRRGQDRLRQRGTDLAAAVGARGVLELPDPAGPHRRLRLPAAHRAGQEEDPRREPAPPARHGRRGDPGPAGGLSPTVTSSDR